MTVKKDAVYLKDEGALLVARRLSTAVAVLMATFSCLGLLFPDTFYPTLAMREQFLANDVTNLLIGLPLFIIPLIRIMEHQLVRVLLLPGALVYVIYNYMAFTLGRPVDFPAIAGTVISSLSSVALLILLKAIDHEAVKRVLENKVGESVAGWILVVFGFLFMILATSTIISAHKKENSRGKMAVAISDIIVSLGFVGGGLLLLLKKSLGYSIGLGLLVAASSLFVGLVLYFLIASVFVNRPLDMEEVVTVLAMGFVCFIPTGIYLRGVVKSSADSHHQKAS